MTKKPAAAPKSGEIQIGTGIAIGISLGVALGVALDNLALGIAIGISIGAALGLGSQSLKSEESSQNDAKSDNKIIGEK